MIVVINYLIYIILFFYDVIIVIVFKILFFVYKCEMFVLGIDVNYLYKVFSDFSIVVFYFGGWYDDFFFVGECDLLKLGYRSGFRIKWTI